MIILLPLKGFAFSTLVRVDTGRAQVSWKGRGHGCTLNSPAGEASGKKRFPATVSSKINHTMQCV